ncbi:MAG: hypothetical protein AAFX94_04490 [Myxococcota bacterium]
MKNSGVWSAAFVFCACGGGEPGSAAVSEEVPDVVVPTEGPPDDSGSDSSSDSGIPDGGAALTNPLCLNFRLDDGETDVDCGGPNCAPCRFVGDGCQSDEDCADGLACGNRDENDDFRCDLDSCENGIRDGLESDVDCGGGQCFSRCSAGQGCFGDDGQGVAIPLDENCRDLPDYPTAKLNCNEDTQLCDPASCEDGLQNQGEAAADCGVVCDNRCVFRDTCNVRADCPVDAFYIRAPDDTGPYLPPEGGESQFLNEFEVEETGTLDEQVAAAFVGECEARQDAVATGSEVFTCSEPVRIPYVTFTYACADTCSYVAVEAEYLCPSDEDLDLEPCAECASSAECGETIGVVAVDGSAINQEGPIELDRSTDVNLNDEDNPVEAMEAEARAVCEARLAAINDLCVKTLDVVYVIVQPSCTEGGTCTGTTTPYPLTCTREGQAGAFGAPVAFASGSDTITSIAAADMNFDGRVDLVTARNDASTGSHVNQGDVESTMPV